MHLIKPGALSVSHRPIEYKGRFGLSLSAALHVPFAQGAEGVLWGEQSMWDFLAKAMPVPLIDECVAKLTPEFLVHGKAYAPADSPSQCAVRVGLAGTQKTAIVCGDRAWAGGRATAPLAFPDGMPLVWERAYGGADWPANPVGCGRAAQSGVLRLPNIEDPRDRWTEPGRAATSVGWGRVDPTAPQRAQYQGTYDTDYLQQHAPGYPPDLDWRHFNLAPPDQWLAAPLQGDEPYVIDHLHPQQVRIQGRLPGLRVRLFADYRIAPGHAPEAFKLKEVPTRLTTVWFFPNDERMVLIWHGLAEVSEHDGSDIERLLGAVERVGQAKADTHYIDVLKRRLDPLYGAVESLNDADLLPDGVDTTDPAAQQAADAFRMEGLQAHAQYRRAQIDVALAREQLVAQGKDPDALGLRMPEREKAPSVAELPAYLKRQRKALEHEQLLALDETLEHMERALEWAKRQRVDLAQLAHRGPPTYRAEPDFEQLSAQFKSAGRPINEPALREKLLLKETAERIAYLQSAHLQPPAHPQAAAAAAATRKEVVWMLQRGLKTWPQIDLTGADLSQMDLRGLDMSGAWLESANLAGANLSGCNLTGAVLAHANLQGTLLVGAQLLGANLGGAQVAGAVFDQSDLSGAVLSTTDLSRSHARKARLAGAQMLHTRWGGADWNGADLSGVTFYQLDLRGLVLAEAVLDGAQFIECQAAGLDFSASQLNGTTFVGCHLQAARFAGAQGQGVVFTQGCDLRGAVFSHARLIQSNWGDTQAPGSHWTSAQLDGGNFTQADLSSADLRLASLKGALLRKARLVGARLAGANLQGALLPYADARAADFRGSNLFGADLSRVALDTHTRFENALTDRARTWPRLTAAQQAIVAARDPIGGPV